MVAVGAGWMSQCEKKEKSSVSAEEYAKLCLYQTEWAVRIVETVDVYFG
jgi:hypothetical protein